MTDRKSPADIVGAAQIWLGAQAFDAIKKNEINLQLTYWKNSIACGYAAGEEHARRLLAAFGVPGFGGVA